MHPYADHPHRRQQRLTYDPSIRLRFSVRLLPASSRIVCPRSSHRIRLSPTQPLNQRRCCSEIRPRSFRSSLAPLLASITVTNSVWKPTSSIRTCLPIAVCHQHQTLVQQAIVVASKQNPSTSGASSSRLIVNDARSVRCLAYNVHCLPAYRPSIGSRPLTLPTARHLPLRCRPVESSLGEEGGTPYYGASAAHQTRYTLNIIRYSSGA
ncbi:hypothetical protein ACLOJK_029055 [Asimina triloba]